MSKGIVYHQDHLLTLTARVVGALFDEGDDVTQTCFTNLPDTLSQIVQATQPVEDSSLMVFVFEEDETIDFDRLTAAVLRLPKTVQVLFVRPIGATVSAMYVTMYDVPSPDLRAKIVALNRLSRD